MRWIHSCAMVGTLGLTLIAAPAQRDAELLIRGGEVVTAEGQRLADVRVVGPTITEIGTQLLARDEDTLEIDARGRLVLPGGIDPHVHLGANRADDYTTASAAAFAGGITTISNFVGVSADSTPGAALEGEAPRVRAESIADVLLHPIISNPAVATPETLEELAVGGSSSIKVFMVRPSFDRNAAGFVATMHAARRAGVLVMMHCEDAAIIQTTAERLMAEGRGSLEHFPDARPVAAEVAATQRAVAMSEATGTPIYIVHLSSERALRIAEDAQRRGLPVYVETRPIYLHLTRERFEGPTPGLYVGQPPLRERSDLDALWQGIASGSVHVVATDHVAYMREEKLDPSQTVARHRAGMSNLQVMLPMLFSDGVGSGRISLDRFVEVTSTNPAKLFGIYPRKGVVAVGSDADLVLWDPDETRTILDEDMFSGSGYSVHAGRVVTGWPTLTMRRGEIVYRDREIRGEAGSGQLVPRSRWQDPGL